jgi:hypothetical protein
MELVRVNLRRYYGSFSENPRRSAPTLCLSQFFPSHSRPYPITETFGRVICISGYLVRYIVPKSRYSNRPLPWFSFVPLNKCYDNVDPSQFSRYNHRSIRHHVTLTVLSPSWGAANCAATQELPSILCNPKVLYRVHKSPALVPILSHINPIHTIPSYLSKIHCNITYVLVFPVVPFLLAFPPISYVNSSSPPFVLHATPISSFLTWLF